MATDSQNARAMAERIARRISSGQPSASQSPDRTSVSSELASVRAGLNDLQQKLARLESKLGGTPTSAGSSRSENFVPLTHSPWLAGVNASHPSQEKFGVEEAAVTELVDFFEKEKQCSMEPGGKPCDHCAMCSSRGF
jgi:hypothetical protein